jgi:hypothetical protein
MYCRVVKQMTDVSEVRATSIFRAIRVVRQMSTDVSDVRAASIIRSMIALMMEAALAS